MRPGANTDLYNTIINC